ncbi:hypothetical protein C7B64_12710 [Merismopedia glauca CCAP 1448/3]|uniref:Uncharacterized protein n=2 Tax=Merismopedia TaxID=53402 RepID=A0A2T1C2M7_9CYAN|nr:hypothetical protein C7B64_12710 [Merismopedia glauca CCAP 1448/3]
MIGLILRGRVLFDIDNFGLIYLLNPPLPVYEDRSVLIFQSDKQPQLLQGKDALFMLEEIPLTLIANEIFGWLKVGD